MRTLAIVLGLAFAAVAIVYWLVPAGSLPSVFPGFEAGSPRVHVKHGLAAAAAAVVLFAAPGDPARDGTAGALSERHSAFHGMMTRSSSLRASVIRKPMIAITNKPTYICSTANVLQALQIR